MTELTHEDPHETSPAENTSSDGGHDQPLVTSLSRSWVIRMGVMMAAAFGLGLWGLYDAMIAYPKRGQVAAEQLEKVYLELADSRGRISSAGVDDPFDEYQKLGNKVSDELDQSRFAWLDALAIIGRLDPAYTELPREGVDARQRLDLLVSKFNTQVAPKQLHKYDVMVQWGIFGIGCGIGSLMVLYVVRVSRVRYRWDPDQKSLTLPRGQSFATDDVEIFDRRKWHKFIMYATIKPDHAALGGKELKFDLLKYAPLETWILEMEAIVSPPEQDEASAEPAEAEASA